MWVLIVAGIALTILLVLTEMSRRGWLFRDDSIEDDSLEG
jgi:hypothetical protein